MNPRYLAYCRSINKTPKEEREDRKGKSMHEFLAWMHARKAEFCKEKKLDNNAFRVLLDADGGNEVYDEWLAERAVVIGAQSIACQPA